MPSIEPNLFHNAALQPETLVSNETYVTEDAEIRPRSYGARPGHKACK